MDNDTDTMAPGNGLSIHSGFPNPAASGGAGQTLALDLNRLLIAHPSATYLFRVSGHHWADQGLYDGDVAVIDRAITPRKTDLVIGWQQSGFSLYRYAQAPGEFWGVVTATIHCYR